MSTLFRDNTTKLANITLESLFENTTDSVTASTGFIEAMIEASEQDLKLFEAMLAVDAIELKMKNNGAVNESAIAKLHEASIKKVGETILTGIKWLGGKVLALGNAVVTACAKIFDRDTAMLKKYAPIIKQHADEIANKCAENNFSVKYYGFNVDNIDQTFSSMVNFDPPVAFDVANAKNNYKENQEDAIEYYCKLSNGTIDNLIMSHGDKIDKSYIIEVPIKDAKSVITTLDRFTKGKDNIKSLNKMYNDFVKGLKNLEKAFNINSDNDQDSMVKVSKMFGYYRQYALKYCNLAKEFMRLNLQSMSKAVNTFANYAKSIDGSMDESVIDFYNELNDYYIESVFDTKYNINDKYIAPEPKVTNIF